MSMAAALKARNLSHEQSHDRSKCEFCQHFHEFELPDHLLDELSRSNVVIFAGAGVSTENKLVFPWTFYEDIHGTLGLSEQDKPTFPKLMSLFCVRPDGRRKLLERLKGRFSYVTAFPEIYGTATRFHRELSTLFYIDTFVTTNWDDYFERECGATPFVTPADFGLWNICGRKVFKIHGSISNYGSIVATEEDYQEAQQALEKGALGSALKLLLATKTIVYVGYSFSDHDFLSIQQYIVKELKKIAPTAYIVSLDRASESKFRDLGLTPIFTDATHFISVLKDHIRDDGHFLPDERSEGVFPALAKSRLEHERLFNRYRASDRPEIIYAASYQDGLMHAFERILAMSHTGEYSHRCDLIAKLQRYEKIKKDNLRRKRYLDVAYIEGYMNGMLFLLLEDKERRTLPFYFIYGQSDQPRTFAQYSSMLRRVRHHKAALREAERVVKMRLGPNDEIHHTPFIEWDTPP
jgi:hypothetical protein